VREHFWIDDIQQTERLYRQILEYTAMHVASHELLRKALWEQFFMNRCAAVRLITAIVLFALASIAWPQRVDEHRGMMLLDSRDGQRYPL